MTITAVDVDAAPDQVFAVVTDATTYPEWLAGAHRIRDVDPTWPTPGSSFRHVIGLPPILVPGSSTVERLRVPEEFVLRAGMGVLGAAQVRFVLTPLGAGTATRLEVDERFVAGPVGWTWRFARPLVAGLVWGRNAVSLESLRTRIESGDLRAGQASAGASGARAPRRHGDGTHG